MLSEFCSFRESISKNPELLLVSVPGKCREWCFLIMKELIRSEINLVFETVEVEYEYGLWHSFLKIELNDETYIWDGVGVGKEPPYFGSEQDSPMYLRNYRRDNLLMSVLS